jgi:hypothetical protein
VEGAVIGRAEGYTWQVLDCAPHEVGELVALEERERARELYDRCMRDGARLAALETEEAGEPAEASAGAEVAGD